MSEALNLSERLRRGWGVVRWHMNQMWHQFFEHNCLNAAGALTYTTLFAVVPMMAVTYTIFSLIPEYAQVGDQIQSYVFQNFVPGSSDLIQSKLVEFAERARNLTTVGFVMLFVTAFFMLVTIEKSFNTIWHVAEPRRGIQRFLLYWGVLSLGPAFMIAGVVVTVYLFSLPFVSEMNTFGASEMLLSYLPLLLNVAGFTILYYAVPNTHVPFVHALCGGVVTTVVFQAAFGLFAAGSRQFVYDAIYGAFAAVPVFLLWLYLVWVIVLCGAIFVRALALPREDEDHAEPLIIKAARILRLFHKAHEDGRTVSNRDIDNIVVLNKREYDKVFSVLHEYRLLNQTEDERWVLSRNLRAITLWDLYQRLPDGLDINRLKEIKDLPRVVEPLISITQFGSNEMSVSMDQVFSA